MRIPDNQPNVIRHISSGNSLANYRHPDFLTQQGCEWLRCAAAVARCIANPNPKQCLLDIAPNCADCL